MRLTSTQRTDELPRFVLDMLRAVPMAGGGVHPWLHKVSRQLWAHRTREEIIALLTIAVDGCGRNVPQREISAAVDAAKDCAWQPHDRSSYVPTPTPSRWPALNIKARGEIVKDAALVDLWEASPVRIDSNEPRTEEIIDVLFPGNPLLCVGASSYAFDTKPREEWRGELADMQLLVPSPMSKLKGLTQEGKESSHCLDNTGQRRFLVCEFDSGTTDEHAAILLHLASRAPLALAVHSGNKSLHGWFYCAGQTEERLRGFMEYAVSLGADPATWTRSQFVRMPDGTRDNGKSQAVYYFNPKTIKDAR